MPRHVDSPVPSLELIGAACCRYPLLAGQPLARRTLLGWTEANRAAGIGDTAVDIATLLHVFGESLAAPHLHAHDDLDDTSL